MEEEDYETECEELCVHEDEEFSALVFHVETITELKKEKHDELLRHFLVLGGCSVRYFLPFFVSPSWRAFSLRCSCA